MNLYDFYFSDKCKHQELLVMFDAETYDLILTVYVDKMSLLPLYSVYNSYGYNAQSNRNNIKVESDEWVTVEVRRENGTFQLVECHAVGMKVK